MDINYRRYFRIGVLKSFIFNTKCFGIKDALSFPVILSRNVSITDCHRGCIKMEEGSRLSIGLADSFSWPHNKSLLRITGQLIITGIGTHRFCPGTIIHINEGATLSIGKNFFCSGDTRILCFKSISIGDNNLWSFGINVMDSDCHIIMRNNHENLNQSIVFGNKVWVGSNCTILKGSVIADGCILSSGSKITTSSPTHTCNCIVSSTKILAEEITWNDKLQFKSS